MDEKQKAEAQMKACGAKVEMVATHKQAAIDHLKVQELRRLNAEMLNSAYEGPEAILKKAALFKEKLDDLLDPSPHQQPKVAGDPNDTRGPKEVIYDTEIGPLKDQIIACCEKNSIPILAHFEFDGDMRCTTNLGPFAHMGARVAEAALVGGPRAILAVMAGG